MINPLECYFINKGNAAPMIEIWEQHNCPSLMIDPRRSL